MKNNVIITTSVQIRGTDYKFSINKKTTIGDMVRSCNCGECPLGKCPFDFKCKFCCDITMDDWLNLIKGDSNENHD